MSLRASVYPEHGRSAWILAQRPPRNSRPDPAVPHGVFLEEECLAGGEVVASGVVLLTNRECPWRCVMCDLWKDTTLETVPLGAIPRQVEVAVSHWRAKGAMPAQVKLYNSGSFFDPGAIPEADYAPVARQIAFAKHVVVESHPLLIGERARKFRDLLPGTLEVAMGLETAHPEVLAKLNKKFDLTQFRRAADYLAGERIALRVFLLVDPPFMPETQAAEWVIKSAEFAYQCGATAVTLIPTRTGNGAMERLLAAGEFAAPQLRSLEKAQQSVLALRKGRVFADTWSLETVSSCCECFKEREQRITQINRLQHDRPEVMCRSCA